MKVIISGHFDKKVRLWDNRSSSSEPMNEFVVGGKVTSLDLSKDMNLLAVCSRDDQIKVVDLRKGVGAVCQVGGEGFHVGCDWCRLSFSPDASYVTCGAGDGAVSSSVFQLLKRFLSFCFRFISGRSSQGLQRLF